MTKGSDPVSERRPVLVTPPPLGSAALAPQPYAPLQPHAPPWARQTGVDVAVERWLSERSVTECFAASRTLAPTQAEHGAVPEGLDGRLVQALARRGITRLYSHQRKAVLAALEGQHVITATPTASGKSLCLHLPVLDALAKDETASAIYLYPTKALSRDQEHGLHALIREAELGIGALVYDGDTPGDARRIAKNQSRVILTNPDMLHAAILPNHARWARVFQNLRYVVVDELHTYRGVFGSHMAHVLARLKRVAAFHGSEPRFVTATATIGNPREHAARLLGFPPEDVTVVDQTGAPSAERRLFLYNPPIVNAELGIRGSSLKHGVKLAVDLLAARVPTIVFSGSRNSVEVMLKYIRERSPGVPAEAIFGYRGGYLPDKRRAIEKGLRDGAIRCVVATNALELGIDIGDLDAVICVGYPGSIAATWQRFGRAGRRGEKSIAVMVLGSRATDQFMANQPDYVLDANAEEARIDPENVEILVQHLKCAAFELPFRAPRPSAAASGSAGDTARATARPMASESAVRAGRAELRSGPTTLAYAGLDEAGTLEALDYLCRQGLLHASGGQYVWTADTSPASHVSLRSISWDNFVIVDVVANKTLAELDFRSTHTMLHEQAIYQHDAAQYQVERLDYENHKAFVRRVEPDYFTTALTHSRVTILDTAAERDNRHGKLGQGDIKVVETVTGYKKIKFFTHENAGYGDVRLPDLEMHTTGFWWTLPARANGRWSRALLIDALRGAGAALETVSSIALMCEPRDIGRTLGDADELDGDLPDVESPSPLPGDALHLDAPPLDALSLQGLAFETNPPRADARNSARADPGAPRRAADPHYRPTLFLYDALPGGVGLARRIYERTEELMDRASHLIAHCPCKSGCPACIGAAMVHSERKQAARVLLLGALGESVPSGG
jgi:DEAD/DEAH box helicase domain-containing protein